MSNVLEKRSISVAFITAGASIIVASIYALKPPQQYYFAGIGAFFLIAVPSFIGAWNYRHRPQQGTYIISSPSSAYIASIQQAAPTIRDDKVEIQGSLLKGHKCIVTFKMKNNRNVLLDRLSVRIEVTDDGRSRSWSKEFDLPDLLPGENDDHRLSVGLGRRLSERQKVVLVFERDRIEVARMHATIG